MVLVSLLFLSMVCAALPALGQEQQPAEPASSVTVSGGLTLFYAWWDPVWENIDNTFTAILMRGMGIGVPHVINTEMDGGAVLVAPSVSVKLTPQWSLTCNFLFGRYNAKADYLAIWTPYVVPLTMNFHAWKYDADFLLGYRMSDVVRFFFGPKFQGYHYDTDSESLAGSLAPKYEFSFFSGGVGGGVAFTFQLYRDLYLLPTASLFTLIGGGSGKGSGFGSLGGEVETQTSFGVGANAMVSLAYYIESISTTVSCGFRMQYLYYFSKPVEAYVDDGDFFYGIHLTAVYSF